MNLEKLLVINKKALKSQKEIKHNKTHTTKNLSCGDEVSIYLMIKDGVIKDASYKIKGCSVSTSFTYLLTQKIKGRKIEELRKLSDESFFKFLGVPPVSSARIKCALISLVALKHALN